MAIAVNSGSGEAPTETAAFFPGQVLRQRPPIPQSTIESFEPDCVIFHNLHPNSIPVYLNPEVPRFYYQHSAAKACSGARTKAHIWWAVSKYLADAAGIDDSLVFHQPVPAPPKQPSVSRDGNQALLIGRICTPNQAKWDPRVQVPLYGFLAREHPDVWWEFVGCPEELKSQFSEATKNRCSFHAASYTARALFHEWDAMLYYNPALPESYGRTVCEAQRCGCVPIVGNLGGFAEQINSGADGYLCDEHEDFVRAIKHIKDAKLRQNVSAQAKISGDLRGSLSSWRQSFLKWYASTLRSMVNVRQQQQRQ